MRWPAFLSCRKNSLARSDTRTVGGYASWVGPEVLGLHGPGLKDRFVRIERVEGNWTDRSVLSVVITSAEALDLLRQLSVMVLAGSGKL